MTVAEAFLLVFLPCLSGASDMGRVSELFEKARTTDNIPDLWAIPMVRALGPDDVPSLITGLGDANPRIRMVAAFSLGYAAESATPAIAELLRMSRTDTHWIRICALGALGKIAPNDPVVIERAFELLDTKSSMMAEAAAFTLGRVNDDVSKHKVIPRLETILGRGTTEMLGAVKALKNLGPRATATVPILQSLLSSEDVEVAGAASQALQAIGTPEALLTRKRGLDESHEETRRSLGLNFEQLLQELRGPNARRRLRAASRLGDSFRSRTEVVPLIIEGLENDNEQRIVRMGFSRSLAQFDSVDAFVAILKFNQVLAALEGGSKPDGQIDWSKQEYLHVKLHTAVQRRQIKIAEFLISKGVDVNMPYGESPPILLAASSNNEEMTKLLLSHGANPQAKGRFGVTALHMAAATGNLNLARLLLGAGCNPLASSEKGTPIDFAERKNDKAMAELLRDSSGQ